MYFFDAQTCRALSSSCLLLAFFSLHSLLHSPCNDIMPTTKSKLGQIVKNNVVLAINGSWVTVGCSVVLPLVSAVASGNLHLLQVLVHVRSVWSDNYKPQTRSCWSAAAEKISVFSWFKAKCRTRCEWPRSNTKMFIVQNNPYKKPVVATRRKGEISKYWRWTGSSLPSHDLLVAVD